MLCIFISHLFISFIHIRYFYCSVRGCKNYTLPLPTQLDCLSNLYIYLRIHSHINSLCPSTLSLSKSPYLYHSTQTLILYFDFLNSVSTLTKSLVLNKRSSALYSHNLFLKSLKLSVLFIPTGSLLDNFIPIFTALFLQCEKFSVWTHKSSFLLVL